MDVENEKYENLPPEELRRLAKLLNAEVYRCAEYHEEEGMVNNLKLRNALLELAALRELEKVQEGLSVDREGQVERWKQ